MSSLAGGDLSDRKRLRSEQRTATAGIEEVNTVWIELEPDQVTRLNSAACRKSGDQCALHRPRGHVHLWTHRFDEIDDRRRKRLRAAEGIPREVLRSDPHEHVAGSSVRAKTLGL